MSCADGSCLDHKKIDKHVVKSLICKCTGSTYRRQASSYIFQTEIWNLKIDYMHDCTFNVFCLQTTIGEIQTQMQENHERNKQLREENYELANKLKKFIEQSEAREQVIT